MKFNLIRFALLPVTLLACAATLQAAEVTVSAPDSPMLRFAQGKLEAALRQQGDALKRTTNQSPDERTDIVVTVDPSMMTDIGAQGFRRVSSRQGLKITASNERGAMYGVLDLAEQIHMGRPWNKIQERKVKAQLPGLQHRSVVLRSSHVGADGCCRHWRAFRPGQGRVRAAFVEPSRADQVEGTEMKKAVPPKWD